VKKGSRCARNRSVAGEAQCSPLSANLLPSHADSPGGFTLIELLVAITTIAILAAILLPVLSKAKIKTQRTGCTSNLRQLYFAWALYHQENAGWLAESYPLNNTNAWTLGNMKVASEAVNPDLIQRGRLFPYIRGIGSFHCPGDRGVTIAGNVLPSVRSYSMNCFMGWREPGQPAIAPTPTNYVEFFAKDSELRRPSELCVFLDEDERSIDDGFFITDPAGRVWYDFPTISVYRHDFSYGINFADGHAEVWAHRDQSTKTISASMTEQTSNPDLKRLANAATLPK
jgi:prepilin-type N-terminal cleavage/methylation domain-containing protein